MEFAQWDSLALGRGYSFSRLVFFVGRSHEFDGIFRAVIQVPKDKEHVIENYRDDYGYLKYAYACC